MATPRRKVMAARDANTDRDNCPWSLDLIGLPSALCLYFIFSRPVLFEYSCGGCLIRCVTEQGFT